MGIRNKLKITSDWFTEISKSLEIFILLLPSKVAYVGLSESTFSTTVPSIKIPTDKIAEIGEFGNNIYNLSSQYPIVYGILSIFIALSAGIFVSYVRRKISNRINAPKAVPPKAI